LPGTVSGRSFSRATNQTTENGDFQEKEDGSDGTRTRDLRRDSPALNRRNALQIAISIHVWSPPGHRFCF
jgi:hypothetical protein